MAIRFELRDDNVRAARFMVSPLVEAALSFNAYLFPQERGLQHEWIRSMRRLPVALRREIDAFGFVLDFAIPDCLLPGHGRSPASWSEELARIADLEPRAAGFEILRPAFHYEIDAESGPEALEREDVRALVLERASRHGPRARALARLSFSRPDELQSRFVALFEEYWRLGFRAAWERLEPRLLAVARRDARRVAQSGVYSILDGRFTGTIVDRRAGLLIRQSPHEHTVRPTRRRPLVLVPSVFVWPHVRVNCDPPWPLSLIYPPGEIVTETRVAPVPAEITAGQKALGEAARLQILRAIATKPRSTEELADLIGLSPAGTSKHLRVLSDAGLATRRREGYYVLYAADTVRLRALTERLQAYVVPVGDTSA